MGNTIYVIDDYCELLCKELQKIVDAKDITPGVIEIAEMISDTFKNFEKYKMMKYAEEHQDEYRGYYRDGGYDDGQSNYNRYPDYMYNGSGEGYNRGYNTGYRRYNNYGHSTQEMNDHMIKELERVMEQLQSEQSRDVVRRKISELKSQN